MAAVTTTDAATPLMSCATAVTSSMDVTIPGHHQDQQLTFNQVHIL